MNDFWQRSTQLQLSLQMLAKVGLTKVTLALAIGAWAFGDRQAAAQAVISAPPSAEQIQKMKEMHNKMRGRGGPPTPSQSKPEKKKPEKKEKKKDDGDKKKEEGIKTIKRPTDGSGKLDPDRMRLTPDKNGLVQFNYNGHPWADVLQEFADAAKFSFDWQELPADGLNLVTQKKYSLVEARDLLNLHLLARGFTLLKKGEVLTAVKIDKIDPSLVPRVEADDLEDFPPYDFVRVRFKLPQSMDPNKAKDDVKALLSPKATVIPLLNTKRLLIIDSVANLRSVRGLIYAEQLAADSIIKPVVYQILHRRADYVAEQIMIVLGLDPASLKSPQELQLETTRMKLLMQMQQKNKDITKLLKKDGPPVHIAIDRPQNTLLINAPPEFMKMIELTIKSCDVPLGAAIANGVGGRSTQPHKTTTASTDALVSALTEFGQLDPLTRLQSDPKTKTIFAYATEADHRKIEEMIKKIDSTGREIHVIQLRKYSATQLAGTLMAMFGGQEKKEEKSSRRSFFYYGGNNKDDEKKELSFKAMPDVENNRLMVWANAEELASVNKMLARLGETPTGEGRNQDKVRVLSQRSPEETARLLERLKAAYPGKLNIDDSANKPKLEKKGPKVKNEDKVTRRSPLGVGKFLTAQLQAPAREDSNPQSNSKTAPSVNVVVTEDGRIVISSDDPEALNQLEDLMRVIEPPKKEYEKFKLEYVYAYKVVDRLEEYFAEELKGQTESVFDYFGNPSGEKEKKLGPMTLGRRELLRFISDRWTNTVIVQGASASQLSVIKQLIKIYDQAPEPKDYYSRKTEVIELKYARAQDIAKSLKEVYRELLSSKDKEFEDKEGGSSFLGDEKTYVFGEVSKDEEGIERPVLISFDGVLSIGVDEVSNSLVISAREEVLENIKETVEILDKAATPQTTIHVHRVGGTLSAEKMQKTLKDSLSQPWPGGKPQQAAGKAKSGGKGEQPKAEGDSNNKRRRGR